MKAKPAKKRRTRICPWCETRVEIERGANVEHPNPKTNKRCTGSGLAPIPCGREKP